jgi:polyhydroxyalkanoate synthesis regulator phasin
MNHKTTILYLIAILLPALSCPSLAAPPPNPTPSDVSGNTAGGSNTLLNNISGGGPGSGQANTGFGSNVLRMNTIGNGNTGVGISALFNNVSGGGNTAIGDGSLQFNTIGGSNTGVGLFALNSNKSGGSNTALGSYSLFDNIGFSNTAIGEAALQHSRGDFNTAIGYLAGSNLTGGNNNIYLMHPGPSGVESNTIRIGTSHNNTFIAGVFARTIGTNGVPVMVDRAGRLGTVLSSARYKKDIQDMKDASHKLLQLRPVTYRYKESDENGANPIEYGLIAEEVAKVYPDLVAYGADGKIETVQYQKLTPMLLNEVQHMNSLLESEKQKGSFIEEQLKNEQLKNQQQAQEIADLKLQAQKVAALELQVSVLQNQSKQIELLTSRLSHIEAQRSVGIVEPNFHKLTKNPG